jgi:hypothetical protein
MLKVYLNGFWSGFHNPIYDPNNINFFEHLFYKVPKLSNFKIIDNLDEANVLFESAVWSNTNSLVFYKEWRYKIHFSPEPISNPFNHYDIVFVSEKSQTNVVDLPLCVSYIWGRSVFDKLLCRNYTNIIPEKFCCFIVSNDKCEIRNKLFRDISKYRKVDSCGKYANNVGFFLDTNNYWSDEYINFISQYKFIICCENSANGTYISEKIINAYLANTIPIYWSTSHVFNMFNPQSMIFLHNNDYQAVVNKVIELDNDDEAYLDMLNQNILNIDYWDENYSADAIADKINKIL